MAPHDKGAYFNDPHRERVWPVFKAHPVQQRIHHFIAVSLCIGRPAIGTPELVVDDTGTLSANA
jgi:hypothetical protein